MTLDDARAALRFISPADRSTWIRVGMALRSEFGDSAHHLFHTWSAGWGGYKRRDAETAWRSFRPGKVTIGTLVHLAKAGGWQPRERDALKPRPSAASLRRQREQEKKRAARFERQRQDNALAAASNVFEAIREAKQEPHPYLRSKGFGKMPGLVAPDGRLLIPVWDAKGELKSAQWIDANGDKLFERGGEIGGNFHRIGRERRIIVCEGYATGLSIHTALSSRHLRFEVRVCFSAHNLTRVARDAKQRRLEVLAVADHDKSGVGEQAARKAGVHYWRPGQVGQDANDFMLEHGIDALASALSKFISKERNQR